MTDADKVLILKRELQASAADLDNGKSPLIVASQMLYTVRLVESR